MLAFCWPHLKVLILPWWFMLGIKMGTYSVIEAMVLDTSSQEAYQVTVMKTASSDSLKRLHLFRKHLIRLKKN